VDYYVGTTVQKLYKGKHSSRDPKSSQHWLPNLVSTDMSCSQAQFIVLLLNNIILMSILLEMLGWF